MPSPAKRLPFPALRLLGASAPLPEDFGGYQSFPMLALAGSAVIMGFRRGRGLEHEPGSATGHGAGGDIHLARSSDAGRGFDPSRPVMRHLPGTTNEHDALLSSLPDGRLALITRSHGPREFLNRLQFSTDGGAHFGPAANLVVPGGYGAFFGHLLPDASGQMLLGSFYHGGGVVVVEADPARFTTPSADPIALAVRGVIHTVSGTPRLNETSLGRLASGRLVALSREQPVRRGIHVSFSDDDGRSFTPPEPIGVIGEAPAVLVLPGDGLLALYRDLDPDRLSGAQYEDPDAASEPDDDEETRPRPCAVSLVHSPDGGRTWSAPHVLARYAGGRYHGGYGDLLLLPGGDILAACHLAPTPGDLPVLACYRFRMS